MQGDGGYVDTMVCSFQCTGTETDLQSVKVASSHSTTAVFKLNSNLNKTPLLSPSAATLLRGLVEGKGKMLVCTIQYICMSGRARERERERERERGGRIKKRRERAIVSSYIIATGVCVRWVSIRYLDVVAAACFWVVFESSLPVAAVKNLRVSMI